jgi:hypothetical protein
MVAIKTVQKIVLVAKFPKIKVNKITVVEDEDYEGNSILRIDINFTAKDGDFDPAKMGSCRA